MSMKNIVCGNCGTVGQFRNERPGSAFVELFLFLFFIVPGILYGLWRIANKKPVCKVCGSSRYIPLDSPQGKMLTGDKIV